MTKPISRRQFSSEFILGGIGFFILSVQGCSNVPFVSTYDSTKHHPLSEAQYLTLESILNVLFPDDGNGPNIYHINALEHICWVLNDLLQDPKENAYILDKTDSSLGLVKEIEDTGLHLLPARKQSRMVERIYEEKWGKYYLSRLTTLVFEALLCDPAYGVNSNEVGWQWLEHSPGQPRAKKTHLYPQITASI